MDNNYIQEAKKKMEQSATNAGMTNSAMTTGITSSTGMTSGMTSGITSGAMTSSTNEASLQEARRLNAESRAKKGSLS